MLLIILQKLVLLKSLSRKSDRFIELTERDMQLFGIIIFHYFSPVTISFINLILLWHKIKWNSLYSQWIYIYIYICMYISYICMYITYMHTYILFSMSYQTNPAQTLQFPADLVTFSGEILDVKLHFLCSVKVSEYLLIIIHQIYFSVKTHETKQSIQE